MTGTGPADLYVRRGAAPTTDLYDCRPFAEGAAETRDLAGIGTYYVHVRGAGGSAQASLAIQYGAPGAGDPTPQDRVNCFRINPDNTASPYLPAKAGIYAAAAHLGPTAGIFSAAFPADEYGDRWVLEYGKYKSRVSMPKGNHPRLSQDQFDVMAEWFARGLPQLETYLEEEPAPTSCTPYVSSAMVAHVDAMATQGWRAINADRGMNARRAAPAPATRPRAPPFCRAPAARATAPAGSRCWAPSSACLLSLTS
ncbi:MAG: PPC domain-containing protein [Kofleriaceae bacterium]